MNKILIRVLVVILFLASIGFGAYKGLEHNRKIKEANARAVVTFAQMNKSLTGKYELKSDKDVKNILLVGTDKRGSEQGYGRSDCMVVATIDSKDKQLKLTSLLGDTIVDVPGHGENKLSMAYSMGGISLLYETIASNFGIQLDNYAIMSFQDFTKAIDQVGGVNINITDFEAAYLQNNYKDSVHDVQTGENQLSGAQALAYVRIKQDAQSNFGRAKRINNVLTSLNTKLLNTSVAELVPIITGLLKDTTSDINSTVMKSYMASVIELSTGGIFQYTIPTDGKYSAVTDDGQLAYRVKNDTVKNDLVNYIYNPVTSGTDSVTQ